MKIIVGGRACGLCASEYELMQVQFQWDCECKRECDCERTVIVYASA